MADQAKTEDEPSIEEILDSIRQIISEDDEEESDDSEVGQESAPEPAAPAPEVAPASSAVLDQSAVDAMDFDAPMSSEPLDQSAIDDMDFDAPASDADDDDVLDLTERVGSAADDMDVDFVEEPEEEPEPEAIPEPIPEPVFVEPKVEVAEPQESLLTQNAESAAVSAISELVRKTAVESQGITLEDIVRTELKPLLRTWLDKNLPVVIERLVREELERVSKRVLEE